MRNNIKNIVIILLILLLGLICSILFVCYQENKNLNEEIKKGKTIQNKLLFRNEVLIKLIKEAQIEIDSIKGQSSKSKKIDGILLGNDPISIEQLINIANKYQNDNIVLKNKFIKDSLSLDRLNKIIEQLEKDKVLNRDKKGGLSYRQVTKLDSIYDLRVSELYKKESELEARNMLLGLIKKNYDIDSEIEIKDGKIKVKLINTKKLDSALWVYPYYKHKIKTNRKGETVIK